MIEKTSLHRAVIAWQAVFKNKKGNELIKSVLWNALNDLLIFERSIF